MKPSETNCLRHHSDKFPRDATLPVHTHTPSLSIYDINTLRNEDRAHCVAREPIDKVAEVRRFMRG